MGVGVGVGVGVVGVVGGSDVVDATVLTSGALDFAGLGELGDKGTENELGTEGKETDVKMT